jgi:hypothetical protein
MYWDAIKDFLAGPEGPITCLAAVYFFASVADWLYKTEYPSQKRLKVGIFFTLAALIAVRHFEFAAWEQYAIGAAIYLGCGYVLDGTAPRTK